MVEKPSYTDYKQSYVAFVDLLGFASQVDRIHSETDFDRIADMLHLLREDAHTHNQLKNVNFTITCISDSVIITIPSSDRFAGYKMLTYLHQLQYYMLLGFNQLMRGYLSVGPAYHKEGYIFGPAYSYSYKQENKKGPPRIVVDRCIVQQGLTSIMYSGTPLEYLDVPDMLSEDSDGEYFVDYLRPVGVLAKDPKDILVAQRVTIRNGSNTAQQRSLSM